MNFELFYKGRPIIVDTGVSTYEKNDRRLLERSTSSHNCVGLGSNSSDVWSGFRVGKRAKVKIGLDDHQKLTAAHDGFGPLTSRTFDSAVTGQMTISDILISKSTSNNYYGQGYLHFHPDVHLERVNEDTFLINNQIELTFQSDESNPSIIELENYSYAKGYNTLIDAMVISYSVFEQTIIQIREVKMNTLLTDNFPPEVNAPATRTFEHASEWVGKGYEVTVITCAPNFPHGKVYEGFKNKLISREEKDGIKVIRVLDLYYSK